MKIVFPLQKIASYCACKVIIGLGGVGGQSCWWPNARKFMMSIQSGALSAKDCFCACRAIKFLGLVADKIRANIGEHLKVVNSQPQGLLMLAVCLLFSGDMSMTKCLRCAHIPKGRFLLWVQSYGIF